MNASGALHPAFKHGESHSKLYHVWDSMKRRCNNPKNPRYKDYGQRGIEICDEWYEYKKFSEWAKSYGYVEGLFLDRIENDLGYSPGNCRWLTQQASAINKRTTKLTTAQVFEIRKRVAAGETQVSVAEEYKVHPAHISRIFNRKNRKSE